MGSEDVQHLEHHVNEGGLLVFLPGVGLLRHLLRLRLGLHLYSIYM